MSDTVLRHRHLTDDAVLDLAGLARAAYADNYRKLPRAEKVEGWTSLSRKQLLNHGLDPEFVDRGADTFTRETSSLLPFFRSDANATLYRLRGEPVVALAIRGTDSPTRDREDWLSVDDHADEFDPLLDTLASYVAAKEIEEVRITGHSLGGGVTERLMQRTDAEGIEGVRYTALAIASPLASLEPRDDRLLNFGHEGDGVYSINGRKGDNAVSEVHVVFDKTGNAARGLETFDFGDHHWMDNYLATMQSLMASEIVPTLDDLAGIVVDHHDVGRTSRQEQNFFLSPAAYPAGRDGPALILGQDEGGQLRRGEQRVEASADDFLVGTWRFADILEGLGGDDVLLGDGRLTNRVQADTLIGGEGADVFMGRPKGLHKDVIADLEAGDTIRLIGELDPDNLKVREGRGDRPDRIVLQHDAGQAGWKGWTKNVAIEADLPGGARLEVQPYDPATKTTDIAVVSDVPAAYFGGGALHGLYRLGERGAELVVPRDQGTNPDRWFGFTDFFTDGAGGLGWFAPFTRENGITHLAHVTLEGGKPALQSVVDWRRSGEFVQIDPGTGRLEDQSNIWIDLFDRTFQDIPGHGYFGIVEVEVRRGGEIVRSGGDFGTGLWTATQTGRDRDGDGLRDWRTVDRLRWPEGENPLLLDELDSVTVDSRGTFVGLTGEAAPRMVRLDYEDGGRIRLREIDVADAEGYRFTAADFTSDDVLVMVGRKFGDDALFRVDPRSGAAERIDGTAGFVAAMDAAADRIEFARTDFETDLSYDDLLAVAMALPDDLPA